MRNTAGRTVGIVHRGSMRHLGEQPVGTRCSRVDVVAKSHVFGICKQADDLMVAKAKQSGTIAPVIGIIWKDAVLRDDAIANVLSRVRDTRGEVEVVRVDGGKNPEDSNEAATILDELRTPSLFGASRVVKVVDADPWISENRKLLERYCEAPEADAVLLLVCGSLPANQRIYKLIDKLGGIIKCPELKGADLIRWIPLRAKEQYGKKLSAAGARALRERVGNEPAMLDAELSKLATYVGDVEQISEAAIEAVSVPLKEQTVFAVTDAMAEGNVSRALEAWDETLAGGVGAAERALGGLAWTIRRMLSAFGGGSGRSSGWVDRGMVERAQRVGREALLRQQKDLAALDLAVKTGLTSPQQGVELFIVKHTSGRRTRADHHS